jgi:hemolysin activation/secretion protein
MLFGGGAPAYAVDEPTPGATVIDEFRADKDLLASSILRIDAFEARLGPVAFVGHAGPYEARLEEIASDLSLRVPLRTADLVAAVQSMAELPGLTVRATTTRDEARQNSYGLTVESEYKPFAATVQLANRGTRDVGPMFVFNEIAASGLLGFSERLGAFASTATDTDEYRGGGLFVAAPVGRFGWSAAFEAEELNTENVRVLELGGSFAGSRTNASQYFVGVRVRRGLDVFGSELDTPQNFLSTRLEVTQLRQFAERWSVRFDAFAQHSAYVLPAVERYRLADERRSRGFEVSQIAGDEGLGAKAELRRDLSAAAAPLGKASLYGYYDFAAAWKQDTPGRESAATAGIGFAVDYWRLCGSIEVAKPLTHPDATGDREPKVFAEVSLKL